VAGPHEGSVEGQGAAAFEDAIDDGGGQVFVVEHGSPRVQCSRYIHLNPNRSRPTRPAERYRWSSYRNYFGGPPRVPWVSTGRILDELGGDRNGYRRYVESGKGEKAISPFERAVAGLVLGSAAFVSKVKERLVERSSSPEEPSLRHLARHGVPPPEDVEAAVAEVFKAEAPRRQRRLVYYALWRSSSLGVSAIARRCGRTPAAVTIATRQLGEEAGRNPALSAGMQRIAMILIEARR
jgi:hypothetical protein